MSSIERPPIEVETVKRKPGVIIEWEETVKG